MIKIISNSDELINKFNYGVSNSNPFINLIGYYIEDKLIGFIDYSLIYDKIEINFIFIDENYRQKGIALSLFDYVLKEHANIKNITLEVKKNNYPAINLYKKLGFVEVAIREKYYDGIDGILMIKEV